MIQVEVGNCCGHVYACPEINPLPWQAFSPLKNAGTRYGDFDGHNDLLLNLWLHHREDPVSAFFAGIENGHLDYPRMLQGGFAGGYSRYSCHRRNILPV